MKNSFHLLGDSGWKIYYSVNKVKDPGNVKKRYSLCRSEKSDVEVGYKRKMGCELKTGQNKGGR